MLSLSSSLLTLAKVRVVLILCVVAVGAKNEETHAGEHVGHAASAKRFDLDAFDALKKRFDLSGGDFYGYGGNDAPLLKRFDFDAYGGRFLRKRSDTPESQQKRFDLGSYGLYDYSYGSGNAQKRFDVFSKRFDIGALQFQPNGASVNAFAPTGPRTFYRMIDALPLESLLSLAASSRPVGGSSAFLDKRSADVASFL